MSSQGNVRRPWRIQCQWEEPAKTGDGLGSYPRAMGSKAIVTPRTTHGDARGIADRMIAEIATGADAYNIEAVVSPGEPAAFEYVRDYSLPAFKRHGKTVNGAGPTPSNPAELSDTVKAMWAGTTVAPPVSSGIEQRRKDLQ